MEVSQQITPLNTATPESRKSFIKEASARDQTLRVGNPTGIPQPGFKLILKRTQKVNLARQTS